MTTDSDKITSFLHEKINLLTYSSDAGWTKCPAWAKYLIKLGTVLGAQKRYENPFFLVASVPERSFASVMLGFGIVLARTMISDRSHESQERVAELARLGGGTPVVFRDRKRRYKARYEGLISNPERGRYLKIRTEKGTVHYVPLSQAFQIVPSEQTQTALPKKQKGKSYRTASDLLENLLPAESLADFKLRSSLDVVFVGPKKRLLLEMEGPEFCASNKNSVRNYRSGRLSEILRPKTIIPKGSAFRSQVLTSANANIGTRLGNSEPFAFLFDGALPLVKWRNYCKHANQLVILDRTESQYGEGIDLVNNAYINERIQNTLDLALPTPPPGVTVSAFSLVKLST